MNEKEVYNKSIFKITKTEWSKLTEKEKGDILFKM